MKEELCAAFCERLEIAKVPIGLAVGTGFTTQMGDNLIFYISGPDDSGVWRIQDDGTTVPFVEASGADLSVSARAEAFETLLSEYGAEYDTETAELRSRPLAREDVANAAMQFVALMLRVQDLAMLSTERVQSTWVEEATKMLECSLVGKAELEAKAAAFPELEEFPADIVLRTQERAPVALFFGISDTRIYEALLLQSNAKYRLKKNCDVVVLLETDRSVTTKARRRADNHLIVPRFKGAKDEAIGRIIEVTTGERPEVLH